MSGGPMTTATQPKPKSKPSSATRSFTQVGAAAQGLTPRMLNQAMTGPDRTTAKRVFAAMMQMKKIDIAALEAARDG